MTTINAESQHSDYSIGVSISMLKIVASL